MTTQQIPLKTRSLVLLFAILVFAVISFLQNNRTFFAQQNHATVSSNPQKTTPTQEVVCDETITDDLSVLLDQPEEQENSCLFVGCNTFF